MHSGGLQVDVRRPPGPGLPHRAVLGPEREWRLTAAQSLLAEELSGSHRPDMCPRSLPSGKKKSDDGHVISDSLIKRSPNSGTSRDTEQSVQFPPTGTSDVVALPE